MNKLATTVARRCRPGPSTLCALVLVLATPGRAPAPAASPPAPGGAPSPPAGAPANPGGAQPAPAGPATAPAGTQPASLTIEVPAAGDYTVWAIGTAADGQTAVPPARFATASTTYTLGEPPAGLKQYEVSVLDSRTGLVARRSLPAKPDAGARTLRLVAGDFNLLQRLTVEITGAEGKPLANASVVLSDAAGKSSARILSPSASGSVTFESVPLGAAKITVTPAGGGSVTKEISVAAPVGGGAPAVPVALPDVSDVVASATPEPAPVAPASGESQAGETGSASPAAPAPDTGSEAPAAPAPPAPGGGNSLLNTLLSLILLAGLGYGAYVLARQRGWAVDRVLTQLGVQPVSPAPSAAGTAPAPSASAVDPALCPFCGERKDPATGRCACSVDAAAPSPFAAPVTGGGQGPRLIATGGTYMGQIFSLPAEAVIGRDAGNTVPLPDDSTVSRRHARIWAADGGYQIHDEGSSNGTYVNGARVTEATLRPGDEVTIGGTRFRFEV